MFETLKTHFNFIYYISRSDGLIRIDDTSDLFEIMFVEASVGDVLVAREPLPAISALAFAFRNLLELKRENHLRILQVDQLQGN